MTLFPEMFAALTQSGITGRAYKRGLYNLSFENPRDFAEDKHKSVDDKPYGGGPGMVMSVQPLVKALGAAKQSILDSTDNGSGKNNLAAKVVYMSPQGEPLNQSKVQQLAEEKNLVILCGRYEGIDERIIESHVDEEVSIGDYVISGGEMAAMVLLDAMVRLQPGALNSSDSAIMDSFAGTAGLLDYPHYTRPEHVEGKSVPDVLLSGDHAAIAKWRAKMSLLRTFQRRPDLIVESKLSNLEKALFVEVKAEINGSSTKRH